MDGQMSQENSRAKEVENPIVLVIEIFENI